MPNNSPSQSGEESQSPRKKRHVQPSHKDSQDSKGDWWDALEFKRAQKRREKATAKSTAAPKPSRPKAQLKEIHTIVPLFIGASTIGLVLGMPFAFAALGCDTEETYQFAMKSALQPPMYAILTTAFAYGLTRLPASIQDKSASPVLMVVGGPFLSLAFFYAAASIGVGNFLLRFLGYRGSEETAFDAEPASERAKRVITCCSECREQVEAPRDRIGYYFECPSCGKSFKVENLS